jgi:hypothetical protein
MIHTPVLHQCIENVVHSRGAGLLTHSNARKEIQKQSIELHRELFDRVFAQAGRDPNSCMREAIAVDEDTDTCCFYVAVGHRPVARSHRDVVRLDDLAIA